MSDHDPDTELGRLYSVQSPSRPMASASHSLDVKATTRQIPLVRIRLRVLRQAAGISAAMIPAFRRICCQSCRALSSPAFQTTALEILTMEFFPDPRWRTRVAAAVTPPSVIPHLVGISALGFRRRSEVAAGLRRRQWSLSGGLVCFFEPVGNRKWPRVSAAENVNKIKLQNKKKKARK